MLTGFLVLIAYALGAGNVLLIQRLMRNDDEEFPND